MLQVFIQAVLCNTIDLQRPSIFHFPTPTPTSGTTITDGLINTASYTKNRPCLSISVHTVRVSIEEVSGSAQTANGSPKMGHAEVFPELDEVGRTARFEVEADGMRVKQVKSIQPFWAPGGVHRWPICSIDGTLFYSSTACKNTLHHWIV